MKISNLLIALIFVFTMACTGNTSSDHGHEHGSDTHEHSHEDAHAEGDDHHHEQEEFSVESDTTKSAVHTHEDGTTHEDH